jgi:hypothetical protein
MFNYGVRMMYDFMVPEPAAFLISALQTAHANAIELEKPTPFTLRPDQIHESNFHTWVQEYGATDVQPPPELYKTKSLDHNANAEDRNVEFTHSGQIAVEDGYKAIHGTIGCVRTIWESEAVLSLLSLTSSETLQSRSRSSASVRIGLLRNGGWRRMPN